MNKKIISLLVLLLSVSSVFAQTQLEKGRWRVGGGGNIAFSTQGNTAISPVGTLTTFGFNILGGYNVIQNLSLGVVSDYYLFGSSQTSGSVTVTNTSQSILFGPIARYTYPLNEQVGIFLEGSYSFGQSFQNTTITGAPGPNTDTKVNQTVIAIGPGLSLFFGDKISLDLGIKYTLSNSYNVGGANIPLGNNGAINSSGFRSNIGFSLYF
jgi:hypothetical protein